jgi:peptide/nickel transport system substrate-binding protein
MPKIRSRRFASAVATVRSCGRLRRRQAGPGVGGTVDDLPVALAQKMPRGALRFDPVAGLFGLAPTIRSSVVQEADVRRLLSRAIDRQALIAGLRVGGLVPRATLLQAGLEGIGPSSAAGLARAARARAARVLVAEANRIFGVTDRPTLRIAMPNGPGGKYLLARLAMIGRRSVSRSRALPAPASADFVWVDEVAPSTSPPGSCADFAVAWRQSAWRKPSRCWSRRVPRLTLASALRCWSRRDG